MTALAIIAGSLIVWLSVSPLAAVLLGRAIRLADEREVPQSPGGVGEGEATRRRRVGAR